MAKVTLNTLPLFKLPARSTPLVNAYRPTLCGQAVVAVVGAGLRAAQIDVTIKGTTYRLDFGIPARGYGGPFPTGGAIGVELGFPGIQNAYDLPLRQTTASNPYPARLIGNIFIVYCGRRSAGSNSGEQSFQLYYAIGNPNPFAYKLIGYPVDGVGGTPNGPLTTQCGIYDCTNDYTLKFPQIVVADPKSADCITGLTQWPVTAFVNPSFSAGRYTGEPFKGSNNATIYSRAYPSSGLVDYRTSDHGQSVSLPYVRTEGVGNSDTGIPFRASFMNGIGLSAFVGATGQNNPQIVEADSLNCVKSAPKTFFDRYIKSGLILMPMELGSVYPINMTGFTACTSNIGQYIDPNGNRRRWFSWAYHHAVGAPAFDRNVPANGISGATGYVLPDCFVGDSVIAISTNGDAQDSFIEFDLGRPGTPRDGAFGYAAGVTFPDMGPFRTWVDFAGNVYSIWRDSNAEYWQAVSSFETALQGACANFARYFPFTQ